LYPAGAALIPFRFEGRKRLKRRRHAAGSRNPRRRRGRG
jgi:hypothetical protein